MGLQDWPREQEGVHWRGWGLAVAGAWHGERPSQSRIACVGRGSAGHGLGQVMVGDRKLS